MFHYINLKHIPAKSIITFCLLFPFFINARAQYIPSPAQLSTAPAAPGNYYNETRISLIPGFTATATLTNVYSYYIADTCAKPILSLSQSQNYILTSLPGVGGMKSTLDLANRSVCELSQTVQYIDGLGRPIQTVEVMGSPLKKDIVQPIIYDAFGREAQKYLPYTDITADGSYKANAFTAGSGVANFYYPAVSTAPSGAQQSNGIVYNPQPFSLTSLEPSPLSRLLEQGAPGTDWQPVAGNNTGHTVKVTYGTNDQTSTFSTTPGSANQGSRIVAFYTVTINADQSRTLAVNGTYQPGQLSVTITRNENWAPASDGCTNTTEEYKDKVGHVILKRTYNLNTATNLIEKLSTYYVYDELGNVAFVLPPGANPDAGITSAANQTTLNNLCYQYRYDERNRLTQKKVPGKGWEYIVYNKLDQMVATQDAVQRGKSPQEWTVTKYDALGRVVINGIYQYGTTAGQDYTAGIKTQVDGATTRWETASGSAANNGYSNTSFPTSPLSTTLSVNYYDDYRFDGSNPYPFAGGSSQTTGVQTGAKINVLGTASMLWTVNYYDAKGRNIQTYKQHYLGGVVNANNYDDVFSEYNGITSELKTVTRKHYTKNSGGTDKILSLTVINQYKYDHMGRKLQTMEQINGGTNVLLSQLDYNELGQLWKKHLHSTNSGSSFLQDISYAYNERGWLSKINDPSVAATATQLFAQQLTYNQPQYGGSAQYNGNISGQGYRVYNSLSPGLQTAVYSYDKLNRLIAGTSSSGYTEKDITYDLNGNITALNRLTAPNNASLLYSYTGNQLQAVSNSGAVFRSYPLYDANGNAKSDGLGNTINYNQFNLPESVPSKNLGYTYDAASQKLKKVSGTVTTEYISGIQYTGTTIDFIQTEEGRVLNPTTSPNYEYTLTDHLGNNRVTFDQLSGKVSEDDYYPFGLNVARGPVPSLRNKYLYNKKELQDELGQYDFGARLYDPVIAKWSGPDLLADFSHSISPYAYCVNNPTSYIDKYGLDTIKLATVKITATPIRKLTNFLLSTTTLMTNMAFNRTTLLDLKTFVNPPRRVDDASNMGGLFVNSIFRFSRKSNLTGQLLEKLKNDPAFLKWRSELIVKLRLEWQKTKQGGNINQSIAFGGNAWGGVAGFVGTTFNELTWAVRHVDVNASYLMKDDGSIAINYSFTDVLDLRPRAGAGWGYNVITAVTGSVYHDTLGGNPNMETHAEWSENVKWGD